MDANEFLKKVPPGARRSKLAPWLDDIRNLRASDYTLEQVCTFLEANGVTITIAGLSAYLRRMEAREQEQGIKRPTKPQPSPTSTSTPAGQPAGGQQAGEGIEGDAPAASAKRITNPTELKGARDREINLDDFIDKE